MTTPSTTRRAGPFNGNGLTTNFPFYFKIFEDTDIAVTLADADGVETTLALTTDYTVTINADQDVSPGGLIVAITAPATGETLVIVGDLDYDQQADLPNGGNFNPTVIENALDRLTMQVQQLAELVGRSLRLQVTDADADPELPVPSANDIIGWDASATALVNIDPATLVSSVAYGSEYYDTFSGTGAQTAFTLSVAPGSLANLQVHIAGVRQYPGTDYTVSGTTLTFSSAPPAGTNNILAVYGSTVPTETILPNCFAVAASDEITGITAGTNKVKFRMPFAMTLTEVRASLSTAQTSGNIFTVDINEGGSSILSTKLTIDNGEKTSTTATACVISDLALADDAEITIDVDQIGDGTAKGLKVYLIGVPV